MSPRNTSARSYIEMASAPENPKSLCSARDANGDTDAFRLHTLLSQLLRDYNTFLFNK